MNRTKGRALPVMAAVLIVVGLIGMVAAMTYTAGLRRAATVTVTTRGNGERIYFTGRGHSGPIQVAWEGYAGPGGRIGRSRYNGPAPFGCSECHGRDGRGRTLSMMDWVRIPDIRYGALTSTHSEDGTDKPGLDDVEIARAIREGLEPGGDDLDAFMPRWAMDGIDMKDTIDYLKELDKR